MTTQFLYLVYSSICRIYSFPIIWSLCPVYAWYIPWTTFPSRLVICWVYIWLIPVLANQAAAAMQFGCCVYCTQFWGRQECLKFNAKLGCNARAATDAALFLQPYILLSINRVCVGFNVTVVAIPGNQHDNVHIELAQCTTRKYRAIHSKLRNAGQICKIIKSKSVSIVIWM